MHELRSLGATALLGAACAAGLAPAWAQGELKERGERGPFDWAKRFAPPQKK